MSDRDTVATLAGQLAQALAPLAAAFDSPDATRDFLELLGWHFDTAPPAVLALKGPVLAVTDLVEDGQVDSSDIQQLLGALLDAFTAMSDLGNTTPADDFTTQFPRQIVDYLVADYLMREQPRWGFLFAAVGLIRYTPQDAQGGRPAYLRREVGFEQLGDFFSDPLTFFENHYGWGQSTFDGEQFAGAMEGVLEAWGLTVRDQLVSDTTLGQLKSGAESPDDVLDVMLRVALVENSVDSSIFKAGVGLFLLPKTADDEPGFAVLPFATAGFDQEVALTPNVTLQFSGGVDLTGGVGVLVRPNKAIQFFAGLESGTPSSINGQLTLSLQVGEPGDPILILGSPDASRLELGAVSTTAGVRVRNGLEVFVEFALQAGNIVVAPSSKDRDGFIASLLPPNGLNAKFDLVAGFSSSRGLYLAGSGGFEIDIPARVTIGPVEVESAALALRATAGAVPIDVTATLTGDLSVLKATVENVGFTAAFTFPGDRKGNLGPIDLQLQFKPPSGVGIAIDAGPIHGGGFISLKDGQYAGALQLSIYDIAVNAFALIDTKVPGVSYSFVIIISAEFTPIQLGFGFTLNGVGGMVGINRGIDTSALANLVRAGQSEDLLFPKNVVADAPTIVRDLTTVFPATQGRYVFGPLGKLGWGTPTLITGEIGVILEIPGPVVVILGEVKCLLPKPDAPLVKLNVSVDGELDFPKKSFSMDAALHDSVINGYPVSGQMAMRVSWGDQPNFIFSIGGFHPAYTPPPDFPKLQPLAIDLASHGPAKLTVSGFFAVTSNTVQVGGTLSLHASGSGISLDASVSVKALFVFSPFSFEANVDASVKISFHGYGPSVHLSGVLDGPSPWHVKGQVCVSILWWDACLGFDVTFGGNQQITQPTIDPWVGADADGSTPAIVGLHDALSDAGNWSGALVPGTVSSVTRAQGTDTLVDPVGGLTVRQKTAPVETPNPLTKFGVAKTPQPIKFSGVQATLGTGNNTVPLAAVEPVNEFFAPAQFFEMDDGKKLSSKAFEQYQAGYLFATATGNTQGGSRVTFAPQVQTIVLNSDGTHTPVATPYVPSSDAVAAANQRSAVAKGGLTQAGTRRFINRLFTQAFTEQIPTFVIADVTTLTTVTVVDVPAPAVRSATLIALDAFRAQHLELAAGVQVAAIHELAA